jgi:hypothetical protein
MPQTDDTLRRYYAACGMTIRAWAKLESVLTLYVKALLEIDPNRARIVWCAIPRLDLRLDLLRELSATYLDERGLADLEKLLRRVNALAEWRDLVTQSSGGVDSQSGEAVFLSDARGADGSDSFGRRTYTLQQMEAWPADIAALELELLRWLPAFTNLVHATPKALRAGGTGKR